MAKRSTTPQRAPRLKRGSSRARSSAPHKPTVLVLSDSTGNLGRHILTALLTQFPANAVALRFENFIRNEAQVAVALDPTKLNAQAVCHAMVSAKLKRAVADRAHEIGLPCYDLTGGVVEFLSRALDVEPAGDVGALHRLDEAYNQRISAMDFTLSHDDGLGLETLSDADVVLAGVSRTSKTPTSILLAQQGLRAANVSLAMGVEPPVALFRLPREKVVGLTIGARQLAMIRAHRQNAWGMTQSSYGDPARIEEELAWCAAVFRRQRWTVLDVTDRAVEETAARVAELIVRRRGPDKARSQD